MYKTICLGLLESSPIYEEIREKRMALATLNQLAAELKTRHEAWKVELRTTRPGSESQIAAEAMEIAIQEIEDHLSADSEEEAMQFLAEAFRHTPPA